MKLLLPVVIGAFVLLTATLSCAAQKHEVSDNSQCGSQDAARWNNEGNRHAYKGEYQQAIDLYQRAIHEQPTCAGAYVDLGAAYFEMGRYDDAIKSYADAAKYTSELRWVIFFNVGRAYVARGAYDDGLQALSESIKLKPKESSARASRARLYMVLGKYDLAVADIQANLKLKGWKSASAPDWAALEYIAYRLQQQDAQASLFLTEAASKLPDKTNAETALFRFFAQKITAEQLLALAREQADDVINKPLAEKKDLTEAHTYIGIYLQISGKTEDAKTQFEWVRDNGSKDVIAYNLATSWLSTQSKASH